MYAHTVLRCNARGRDVNQKCLHKQIHVRLLIVATYKCNARPYLCADTFSQFLARCIHESMICLDAFIKT